MLKHMLDENHFLIKLEAADRYSMKYNGYNISKYVIYNHHIRSYYNNDINCNTIFNFDCFWKTGDIRDSIYTDPSIEIDKNFINFRQLSQDKQRLYKYDYFISNIKYNYINSKEMLYSEYQLYSNIDGYDIYYPIRLRKYNYYRTSIILNNIISTLMKYNKTVFDYE